MFLKRGFFIAMIAAFMFPAISQIEAQEQASEFTYAAFGSQWVGRQDGVVDTTTDNPLSMTIWYPALNPNANGQAPASNKYQQLNLEGDISHAPYPLIIFSPGFTAPPSQYTNVLEHLASYGFVVIALLHSHDSPELLDTSLIFRLNEVKQAIDFADLLTTSEGILNGMIDTETIAVMGHSYGGTTALGAGGATFNLNTMQEVCGLTPADPTCNNMDANIQGILQTIGIETAPEDGILPAIWDSRVDAIISVAGPFFDYGDMGLKAITVPALMIYGSEDALNVPDTRYAEKWLHPVYGYLENSQKARVIINGGGHNVSTNNGYEKEVNHFTVAFLLATLKGDSQAAMALSPDMAQFPEIEYEAEDF